ncbi:MAG: Na+/H+ antiporter NhaA [Alphaproteobacteria bacterium]|nr:Na+/H+ antiporter NhaA [Alphaproteobacteria bacterium]
MLRRVKKIFELEASTGILLMIATAAALVTANSENHQIYHQFFAIKMPLDLGFIGITKDLTLHDWINDALMAMFFLLVGLELKEEVAAGELSSKSKAMLPLIAACGGVIVPALIFYFFNLDYEENLKGFAIPTATDIAFAYGVICLFGNKIPKSLKVFLISLAIFDDLNAILIIAFFYSQNLAPIYMIFAFVIVMVLAALNLKNHTRVFSYLILGSLLWLMVLKSGVHATIAGVVLAMFIPRQKDVLHNLIKKIAPIVNFFILPVFAFANSGVRIEEFSKEIFTTPLVLGIITGLFIGKQLGVMLFSFVAIKLGLTHLPRSAKGESSWLEFYGVSILTGIGFTMSFFIGSLAFFGNETLFDEVKIGVLAGSLLSTLFGIAVIYLSILLKGGIRGQYTN